ncbi:MAG: RibD family protein [Anaerolineales bacterium]|nr:RibD family protein [Anaerolineales bacterium]
MGAKLSSLYEMIEQVEGPEDRPFVTLTFAQSIDGSISARRGVRTALSGEASLTMTHTLRTLHDAILVGIGTVLVDNPLLTARAVAGPDPQPIVVDSQLRIPPECNLLKAAQPPWIACSPEVEPDLKESLVAKGATVIEIQRGPGGIDLGRLLAELRARGVQSLMVEGGARIIRSFLESDHVDMFVVTIAPRLLAGLWPYDVPADNAALPRFDDPQWAQAGDDVVFWAHAAHA